MKTTILLLSLVIMGVCYPGKSDGTTFNEATFELVIDQPIELDIDSPGKTDQKENSISETIKDNVENYEWSWIHLLIILCVFYGFLIFCKASFFSLTKTEYDLFLLDMERFFIENNEEEYFKRWYRGKKINQFRYLFNLKVWKIHDVLDPFTDTYFRYWLKDNDWRPDLPL